MTSRTFAERGRFPEVKALLFLRGEVPKGPRGHRVTSPGDISSRGQSAQDVHQQPDSWKWDAAAVFSPQRLCASAGFHSSARPLIRSSGWRCVVKSAGVVFGCDENQDTALVSLRMRKVDDSYGELTLFTGKRCSE